MFSQQAPLHATAHVRAATLGPSLANLGRGWVQLGNNIVALHSQNQQNVDITHGPTDGLLWSRTILVRFPDGHWELEEYCQNISA